MSSASRTGASKASILKELQIRVGARRMSSLRRHAGLRARPDGGVAIATPSKRRRGRFSLVHEKERKKGMTLEQVAQRSARKRQAAKSRIAPASASKSRAAKKSAPVANVKKSTPMTDLKQRKMLEAKRRRAAAAAAAARRPAAVVKPARVRSKGGFAAPTAASRANNTTRPAQARKSIVSRPGSTRQPLQKRGTVNKPVAAAAKRQAGGEKRVPIWMRSTKASQARKAAK